MTQREFEQEQAEEARAREAAGPVQAEPSPATTLQPLFGAIGNRAVARALATRPLLARDLEVPPAPVTLDAPAEREKEVFPEADKERARQTVISPLRAAAEKLGAGEKADVASVLRHLRPMRAANAGIKWPDSVRDDAFAAMDDLDPAKTILDSLNLDHRTAVARIRKHWATAKADLKAAANAIRAARPDPKKDPTAQEREGSSQDLNAVLALAAQVDATMVDLVKAPKTKEGLSDVGETAAGLLSEFDTIQPPEAADNMARAKDEMIEGMAVLVPIAEGKAEAIKEAQQEIQKIADRLAGLVGDAPAGSGPGERDEADDTPPPGGSGDDVAPSSHSPLPPPPAPPKAAPAAK